jgi:carbohydrate diacid regulator
MENAMSSRIFQNVIIQLKDSVDRTIGVVDDQGYVIACSELAIIGSRLEDFRSLELENGSKELVTAERTYVSLDSESNKFIYAAFVSGTDAFAKTLCSFSAVAYNEAKSNYEEKHNRAAFIKNVISDNILPGDVYVRAKELHFVTDEPRYVLLVRQKEHSDVAAVELIQRLFPDRQKDFVLNINENDIVVVKTTTAKTTQEDLQKIAKEIENALKDELGIRCVIGISTEAKHLRELADRYKESQVAIDVGKIFEGDKTIINYENLGLGRIIYQLPTTLCEMFLNEVFKKNPIEALDDDTLEPINRFFENNLNVSETSRKMYVHRNTLVYRLEKIKKLTGLDLREFDHAIVFKVAMMVKMYLDSLNSNKY